MTNLVHDPKDPRRATIVQLARKHFVTHGFTATRMEPVARESGVSTATLYGFFESKNTLFEAVINAASDEVAERLKATPADSGSPEQRVTALASFYADFLFDPDIRAVFRLVLAERHRFEDVSNRFFDQGRNLFANHLVKLLKELSTSGALNIRDTNLAAGQLMGMIEHAIFFAPLIDKDGGANNPLPQDIAQEAVTTFLARYKA